MLLIGLGLGIGALLIAQRDGGTDADPQTTPEVEPSPDITPDEVDDPESAETVPVVPATTEAIVPDTEPSTSVEAVTDPEPAPTTQPPVQSTTTVLVVEEPVAEVVPPTTVADPTPDAVLPDESVATVRNGQIFLEGAVPNQEAGDAIAALAGEILGPDNVFNNYVIDPAAGDPNLGNVTVEDTINFATDSAALLDPNEPLLGQGLALMNIRPAMTVTIVGHTDSRGSAEGNKTLSLARAETVKAWFVDRGIDADRLATAGAGATEPIASNETAAGRTENRRIQFFLENILGGA